MIRAVFHKIRGAGTVPARPDLSQILIGWIGGMIGIASTAYLTQLTGVPLLMAPFGATCVLLFALPGAPLAQPRNVIGGHVISALVGMIALHLLGAGAWEMGVAVGSAIALMQIFKVVHPPAGANPIVIMAAGIHDWSFIITPVLTGSAILVLIALVINNLGREKRWPSYWV